MAIVTDGGSEEFDALVFSSPSRTIQNALETRNSGALSRIKEGARTLYNRTSKLISKLDVDRINRISSRLHRRTNFINQDIVTRLLDIEQVQEASPVMRRWVMANPTVRNRVYEGTLSGYDGEYIDEYPGKIGEEHYDYRRVMDGVVTPVDDVYMDSTTYYEEIHDIDHDELSFSQQCDIMDTWITVEDLLVNADTDPTSLFNASI